MGIWEVCFGTYSFASFYCHLAVFYRDFLWRFGMLWLSLIILYVINIMHYHLNNSSPVLSAKQKSHKKKMRVQERRGFCFRLSSMLPAQNAQRRTWKRQDEINKNENCEWRTNQKHSKSLDWCDGMSEEENRNDNGDALQETTNQTVRKTLWQEGQLISFLHTFLSDVTTFFHQMPWCCFSETIAICEATWQRHRIAPCGTSSGCSRISSAVSGMVPEEMVAKKEKRIKAWKGLSKEE